MSEKEIKQLSQQLMESADLAYLATVDSDGFPQVRAMVNMRNAAMNPSAAKAFVGHDDDWLMYFTTHKSSDKMKHIKVNPLASVYFCDSAQRTSLLLVGKIEVASDAKIKKELWQERWIKHFPGGVDDPGYAVLRFVPCCAKGGSPQGPFQLKFAKK